MTIPFRPIARLLARTLRPAPLVDISAAQLLLSQVNRGELDQGVMVTVNHYHAPDFFSWWFVILISAIFPRHIHWVVASGWTNSGWLTGLTHWLFPLGSRLLGFSTMPPMPPDPAEAELRADAVRRILDYARLASQPVIGMSPEGRDIPGAVLGSLPPGVGRFLFLLSRRCPHILPVGIWKENGIIKVKFGNSYKLELPAETSAQERDRVVGEIVMRRIAQCLPEGLRGEYR